MKALLFLAIASVCSAAEVVPDISVYATASRPAYITVSQDGQVSMSREQVAHMLRVLRNAEETYLRLMEFQKVAIATFSDLPPKEKAVLQSNLAAAEAMLKTTRDEIFKWESVESRLKAK